MRMKGGHETDNLFSDYYSKSYYSCLKGFDDLSLSLPLFFFNFAAVAATTTKNVDI